MSIIYRNEEINYYNGNPTAAIHASWFYNYLHQYDNRFTYDNSVNINFDNKFTIQFTTAGSGYQPQFNIVCSDTDHTTYGSYSSSISWQKISTVTAFLIITDELLYFRMGRNSSNYLGFVWLKDKNNVDYVAGMSAGYQSINSLTFHKATANSTSPFRLSPFFNFPMPVGSIYMANTCLINTSTGQDIAEVADWCNCSTLTVNSIITVDGKNYYVLGENTLIPFDLDS